MTSFSIPKQINISLEDIRLYGYHGVMEQERRVGTEYRLSLKVTTKAVEACSTDSLEDTINYAGIYRVCKEEFDIPANLIEHVAARIANRVLKDFHEADEVDITLVKVSPPIPGFSGSASVRLSISR